MTDEARDRVGQIARFIAMSMVTFFVMTAAIAFSFGIAVYIGILVRLFFEGWSLAWRLF